MQKLGIFVSATLIFSFALGALALSPEFPVYDVGQRAVVFYEDGVETLVMSSTFAGSADDFAWLIPTPSKPEVDKVSVGLFSELSTRTSRAFKQTGDIYPVPFMVRGLATESFSGPSITVEETKEVGYYEATVVSATDSQELIRWLAERGYTYPSTQGHLLNDYIKDKWHFTVVRIKPEFADEYIAASLRSGHSTPLKLTFSSDDMIYPFKLSRIKIAHDGNDPKPDYTKQVQEKPTRAYYDDYYYRYKERFPVVIYTIADHRKKLSGFQTEYAGWITKDDVEKLTEPTGGKAWISPKEKKYFLTKLTSNMERSAIDSDLRITDSPNNKTVNAPNPNAIYWFWVIVALSIAISGGAVFLLIRILRHPRSGA